MKKTLALILALAMVFALTACGSAAPAATEAPATEAPVEETAAEEAPAEETAAVMSYADYVAAEMDAEVTIEAYVQAKESWWSDKATVYVQDEDGAYLLYDMAISEEDYALLVPGQLVRVTGFKSEWSGQVEIVDASCEIIEGESYVAEALDVTGIMADTDALAEHMTQFVAVKGLTVSAAPLYNWDGSGDRDSSDVYLTLALDGADYSFTIRRYLTDNTTEVYRAAEALNVGDVIDVECFLYWYEGPQARITSINVVEAAPVVEETAVMSYADYVAAEMDTEVTIEAYVQAKESWWADKATVYVQDEDGAYLLYDMAISEEDYALLVPGQLIRVTGFKSEWSGQVEIVDASCEIIEGDSYIAEALDVTDIMADTDALAEHMTALVAVNGLTVSAEPLYNWDGSGDRDSSDVYLTLALDGVDYSFTVRRYLTNNTTEVYQAAEALEVGQVVNIECFLYWYEGPQARIVSIEVQ